MKKNLVRGLVVTMVFVGGLVGGLTIGKQLPHTQEIKVVDTETRGTKVINTFSDGSWSVADDANGVYAFQPVELGDWDYECNSKEDLGNLINTYKQVKNGKPF